MRCSLSSNSPLDVNAPRPYCIGSQQDSMLRDSWAFAVQDEDHGVDVSFPGGMPKPQMIQGQMQLQGAMQPKASTWVNSGGSGARPKPAPPLGCVRSAEICSAAKQLPAQALFCGSSSGLLACAVLCWSPLLAYQHMQQRLSLSLKLAL